MTTQRRTEITARHLLVLAVVVGVGSGCAEQPGPETAPAVDADEVTTMEEALSIGRPICAGPSDIECPSGQYCRAFTPGRCPGPTVFGVCARRPDVCPQIFDPVCGCDGQTYPNACVAASKGVAVAARGACPVRCQDNSQCAATSYCSKAPGQCGADGSCAPRPQVCATIFQPVCGCDGKTYGNACQAASAGVSIVAIGECGPFCGGIAGFPCPGAGTCIDDPSDDCDPRNGGADCGGLCICKPDATCAPGSHFDPSPTVCACVPNEGPACGSVNCPVGEVCCNASCGICTPPGGGCIQIACEK